MTAPAASKPGAALFALGFLTLFLQLALIRFLAGTIWNLGYFPNLVLIAGFIGHGFGFLLHRKIDQRASLWLYYSVPPALVLFLLLVIWLRPAMPGFSLYEGVVSGELFFTSTGNERAGRLWKFGFWFAGVVLLFFGIGQRMAKVFRRFRPLTAYSLDIGGALCGIAAFIAVSYSQLPPSAWFAMAAAAFWASAPSVGKRLAALLPVAVFAAFSWIMDHPVAVGLLPTDGSVRFETHWSPYQKVQFLEDGQGRDEPYRLVRVNGINHQEIRSTENMRESADWYGLPYRERRRTSLPPPRAVLVLGAGTGNDVAMALASGAERVTAVEIDPAIHALGADHHPDKPYADPRVTTVIGDGRRFLFDTGESYDLIVFALVDSLVKASSMSQLRLENYLLTVEAFQRAAECLSKQGQIVLYNYFRHDWLVDKLMQMLQTALPPGAEIHYVEIEGMGLLTAQPPPKPSPLPKPSPPSPNFGPHEGGMELATDDWPFVYLKKRSLGSLYLASMVVVIGLAALALAAYWRSGPAVRPPLAAAFLLMGCAFLLLETKSIIQFSLLFGTTWLNTSLVFFGILASVLAAAQVADRFAGPRWLPVCSALLVASAALPLFLSPGGLLGFGTEMRLLLACLLMFTPVFLANLVFGILFRDREDAELYFGWNLLGGVIGGALEYVSMVTGYQALSGLVAGLYVAVGALAWAGLRGTALRR